MKVDVLVVGAGPTGLAVGHALGRRGIRTLLIESSQTRAVHPKAKFINVRSMTILRRWGLSDRLVAAAPLPADYPSDVHYVSSLTGDVLASAPGAFPTTLRPDDPFPAPALRIPQPVYEKILEDALATYPTVSLSRGHRLDDLHESAHGVRAQVTDLSTGETRTIHAGYLVGADGARSTVRALIGAAMTGDAAIAHSLGAVFRSPALADQVAAGPAVHYWVINDALPTTPGFGPLDRQGTWFFQAMGVPKNYPATTAQAESIIRVAIGNTTPFDVDDVAPWTVHHLQADRYGAGRIVLVGDAVHLHPPTGGFGLNMGLADALDVGWKLAAMLEGWGAPDLLASYEVERRPVHRSTMLEAVRNFHAVDLRQTFQPGDDLSAKQRQVAAALQGSGPRYFDTMAAQLGYCYESSPLVSHEPPSSPSHRYRPRAEPGHLLPHAWVETGKSTLDVVGEGFAVLAFAGISTDATEKAAWRSRVPLRVVPYRDERIRELLGRDLVLVRPDHHVAWRGDNAERASQALQLASGHVSC